MALLYGIFAELDIITRAVQITNRGQEAVHIEKAASAVLDFMTGEFDVIHFHGRHGMERILERMPVEHGNQVFGSRRGSSSHQQNPFVMLAGKQTGEDAGACTLSACARLFQKRSGGRYFCTDCESAR